MAKSSTQLLSPLRAYYPGSLSAKRFNLRILKHLGMPVERAVFRMDGSDHQVFLDEVEYDFLSQSRQLQKKFGLRLESGSDPVVGPVFRVTSSLGHEPTGFHVNKHEAVCRAVLSLHPSFAQKIWHL